nr:glutamate-1-semialdehyde 2,1-aminomutase [candidate division Zixibacteria bacterium]
MKSFEVSKKLYGEARQCLSGGVNSPVRAFKAVGGTPLYIERGDGAYIFDIDGNRYLDFCCSWGPLILGHAHPEVVKAISEMAAKGTSFGTTHQNEILLAKRIKALCLHMELMRFVSSGTEAVMSAIRLARAFTKRNKVIKFTGCYHGHSDYLLASAGSGVVTLGIPASAGVPKDFTKHTLVIPLNDPDAVGTVFKKHGPDIAAVIIEPIPANNGLLLQKREFLELLRDITRKSGALLIFDEVISGFRVGPGGAAEYYKIKPDLATYGKVVGGGLPVGAFGGRAEIMNLLAPDGPVYQAGTLSGNPLALAAGIATLKYLSDNSGWETLEKNSDRFVAKLRSGLESEPVNVVSIGSIFWINLQAETATKAEQVKSENSQKFARVFQAALQAGIYLAPSAYEVGFVSTAHTPDDLDWAAGQLARIIKENGR